MNPPPAALNKDVTTAQEEIRSPELATSRKRERLLQRVRAASKRFPRTRGGDLARTR
jgi:hypothetical protein